MTGVYREGCMCSIADDTAASSSWILGFGVSDYISFSLFRLLTISQLSAIPEIHSFHAL